MEDQEKKVETKEVVMAAPTCDSKNRLAAAREYAVAQYEKYKIQRCKPDDNGQKTCHQTHTQDCHIQTVGAVTAHHKIAKARGQSCEKLPEPAAQFIHTVITFAKRCFPYYIGKTPDCNRNTRMLTDCLIFL